LGAVIGASPDIHEGIVVESSDGAASVDVAFFLPNPFISFSLAQALSVWEASYL
jgi:hypothetical protein